MFEKYKNNIAVLASSTFFFLGVFVWVVTLAAKYSSHVLGALLPFLLFAMVFSIVKWIQASNL